MPCLCRETRKLLPSSATKLETLWKPPCEQWQLNGNQTETPSFHLQTKNFILPLGLSEYIHTHDIGVPHRRINEIVKGKRSITADTALLLARYFRWPAEVWLNLQAHYGRQVTEAEMRDVLGRIKPCALAA